MKIKGHDVPLYEIIIVGGMFIFVLGFFIYAIVTAYSGGVSSG